MCVIPLKNSNHYFCKAATEATDEKTPAATEAYKNAGSFPPPDITDEPTSESDENEPVAESSTNAATNNDTTPETPAWENRVRLVTDANENSPDYYEVVTTMRSRNPPRYDEHENDECTKYYKLCKLFK